MAIPLQFSQPSDEFPSLLRARVADWHRATGKGRSGGPALWLRSIGVVAAGVAAWSILLFVQPPFPLQLAAWLVFGGAMFLHALVTAHDASHGAYSEHAWVNRALTRTFDLIGMSSYVWQCNHVLSHHGAPNIGHYDAAIDSNPVLRLHPQSPAGPLHRYQHYYFPLAYGLATLQKWFYLDFFTLSRKRIGAIQLPPTPTGELVYLFGMRAFTYTCALVIPLLVIDQAWWLTVSGFVAMHLFAGTAIGVIFQVTHLADKCAFVKPLADGRVGRSWVDHHVATTSEFRRTSQFANFLCGGLNAHLTHHLFPNISHVHLVALSNIVYDTAREAGVPVVEYRTVREAVTSHYRVLRALSSGPPA